MIGWIYQKAAFSSEVKIVRYDPFEARMQTFAWSEISNHIETPIKSGSLL